MGFLDSFGKVVQTMNEQMQKQMAEIEKEKQKYVCYSDQQLLDELATQQKKESWSRSGTKINALKQLVAERGYVHVGNGFYQKR